MKNLTQLEIQAVSGGVQIDAGPIVVAAIIAIAKELIDQLDPKNPNKKNISSSVNEVL